MPELRLENSIVDDRYLVEACLGRGSYAEIFLAYDQLREGQQVIIKALNATLQGTPDLDLERTLIENFQNEAIALDKVRHPNIIRRLGHGTAADLRGVPFHYLLLEYMPGGDLLAVCRHRPLELQSALSYFQQVAEALAHAHSQKVIHRDIKPNNLLLSRDREVVKVADFGVAKMATDEGAEITRVGTNIYAPPEHHPDSPTDGLGERLTPSADIYSLAKTIYTAMTGRAPRQFARQAISELPAELARQGWGDELLRILNKATRARPADRYQSVQGFWADFARLGPATQAGDGADPEATIVRARLTGPAAVGKAAAVPSFHPIASVSYEGSRPQKARIVVEIPRHEPRGAGVENKHAEADSRKGAQRAVTSATTKMPGREGVRVARAGDTVVTDPDDLAVASKEAKQLRTKPMASEADRGATFFDNLRLVIRSGWLRVVFIVFLIFALVGLAISIYSRFAGQKEGVIAGAANVNLRSDPSRQATVFVQMPAGTRVRVYDYSEGWAKVKVIEWAGTPPENAPDTGWIDSRFLKID